MFINVIKAYYISEGWVKMKSASMKMEVPLIWNTAAAESTQQHS